MAGVFAVGFKALAKVEITGFDASIGKYATLAVGTVIEYIVSALGKITVVLIHLLISAAKYNHFIDSEAVTQGWVIIRDVVNMFFIVILLVIAFGTIFNVQNYSYKVMLPRLLIMAVVINFSRTIAGILIDFGQVVMLTFVNGFAAAAGGNFVNALRINELLELSNDAKDISTVGTILVGYLLALFAMIITVVVVGIMLAILIMRIIILQFLVVLSPIAFLSSVWPSQREKYAKWWNMFLDNIIVGPIFAFFLWLSLLVLGSGTVASDFGITSTTDYSGEVAVPTAGPTEFGTPESLMSYVFGIGMLMMSLYMAQGMRSVGAGMAGSALGKIQGYAKAAVTKPAGWAGRKAKEGTLRAGEGAALPILGGLSKVPIIGGVALKGAAKLQQREQARAKKESAYISGLTPDQRTHRLKQLESMPEALRTKSQKNQLATLYRERLGDLPKEEWKADRDKNGKLILNAAGEETMTDKKTGKVYAKNKWYEEKQKEVEKITEFSKTRRAQDPELYKQIMAFDEQRMDFGSDEEVVKNVGRLSTLQAAAISLKVLKDDRVIAGMQEDNRLYAKQHGGAERRKLIEEWEEKKYGNIASLPPSSQSTETLDALAKAGKIELLIDADRLDLTNVDFSANNGLIAQKIAASSNEALKSRIMSSATDRAKYETGLNEAIKQPGDHGAEKMEFLRAGKTAGSVYKFDDATGQFANEKEEDKFKQDISQNKSQISTMLPMLSGEAKIIALESLTITDFVKEWKKANALTGAAQIAAMANLKNLKTEFFAHATSGLVSKEVKDTMREINMNPTLRSI